MTDHTKINQQNKQQDQKRQEQSHENSSAMQSFAPPDSAIQPITDNRPGTVAQRRLQELIDKSPQVQAGSQLQSMIDNSPRQVAQRKALKNIFGGDTAPVQRKAEEEEQTIQAKENNTGLPDNLKTGVEKLSGMSMDDVKVHYSSARPKELNALAYAQGNDIHLGPGQEKHLPHEAWHVVQQRQERVQPTMQMKGVAVNDEDGLEKEADVMGEKVLTGATESVTPVSITTSSTIGVQRKASDGNSLLNDLDTTGAGDITKKQDKLEGLSGVEASKKMAQTDFKHIKNYVTIFIEVGSTYSLPPALLAAVASRESRGGAQLKEDGFGADGNDFGMMQINKANNPKGAYNSKEHVMQAASFLSNFHKQIQKKHPTWNKAQQLRGAVAAYNFGVNDVQTLSGMDVGSTGDDYSSDIWARAKYYASLPEFGATADVAVVKVASNETTSSTSIKAEEVEIKPKDLEEITNTDQTKVDDAVLKSGIAFVTLPEISASMNFSVGKPNEKHSAQLINFAADVRFIQNKLKEIGLLSEADYIKEYPASEAAPEFDATKTVADLTAKEKLLFDKYQKVIVGQQISADSITQTIKAIYLFQTEVAFKGADGRFDSLGSTISTLLTSSKESVIKSRLEYPAKKAAKEAEEKRKVEADKKKAEEEKQKIEKALAEKERIKILTNEPVNEENIDRIYDLYSHDTRVLGTEMVKYAPHNPELVIAMIDRMSYSNADNLAYNITSKIPESQLSSLNKDLINKLYDELDAGYTLDNEMVMLDRLKKVMGGEVASETKTDHNDSELIVNDGQAIKKETASSTKVKGNIEEIGTPMLTEEQYKPYRNDNDKLVTWCNTFCTNLSKSVLGTNPFTSNQDDSSPIHSSMMEKYAKDNTDVWKTITITNGDFTDVWNEINKGAFVVFFIDGHVATGIKTDKMTTWVWSDKNGKKGNGKSYTFGDIIQGGKSVSKFNLVNGFGWTLDKMRVYMYIGSK